MMPILPAKSAREACRSALKIGLFSVYRPAIQAAEGFLAGQQCNEIKDMMVILMHNLIIIGNSHAGRECYHIFKDMLEHDADLRKSVRFKGFLSHDGYAGNLGELAPLLLGDDTTYPMEGDDCFAIGIADTGLRRVAYDNFQAKNAAFFTLLSPFAQVSRDIRWGSANIIGHGCAFSCDITIGDANYFNSAVILGHDVRIGNNNFFGPRSTILGSARIGDENSFGAHSVVLERARIGNGNSIAPASVIYKGCGNNRKLAGNPALFQ
jgi:acetyltransferase-like isoleucine patch superfamily enzyme